MKLVICVVPVKQLFAEYFTKCAEPFVNPEVMADFRALHEKLNLNQCSMKRELNSKIDGLKTSVERLVNKQKEELKAEIESHTKEIQNNIDLEVGHLTA